LTVEFVGCVFPVASVFEGEGSSPSTVDIRLGLWYQPPLGTKGNFRASISVRRAMLVFRGGD
jgi:hypothetical protein